MGNRSAGAVTVIVPCYNEEYGVTEGLETLLGVLSRSRLTFEIIAVDDGSEDGTLGKLEAFGDRIRILRNPANLGYGASLKHGLRKARHPIVAIIDADGTYPADALPALVAEVVSAECDMAVGARTGANVATPLVRRPVKWVLGKFANYVAGQPIPDMNSGLRVFPRGVAERMVPLLPDGFSFTTTITLAMLTNGYGVSFHPIDYFKRVGHSKIRPVRDTLGFIQLITRMSLYFAPLKVFIPLSLGLFVLSVSWGMISYLVLGQLADVSTLVLFVAAVQLGAIGLLADMISTRLPRVHGKGGD